jgi:hypothetical protein
MLFYQVIILTMILNIKAFKGTSIRKHVEVFENPRFLQVNSTVPFNSTVNSTEVLNNKELYNFQQAIEKIRYEGKWVMGSRNNSFLTAASGIMELHIGVYNITANGREIQMKFVIQDGEYKDNWYIIEQNYLYFYNNDADSDVGYNITDSDIVLYDKGYSFRQSTIKAYNLFSYYMRFGNIYFI